MSENVWLLNERARLSHIALLTGFEPETDRASLGGYMNELAGEIPSVGAEFSPPGARLRVLKANNRSVKLVRLTVSYSMEDRENP
jgi:CBS domain containing-hemolysin-like protein